MMRFSGNRRRERTHMRDDGANALAEELRAAPPAGLIAALEDAELRALTDAIRDARQRQSAALRAAGDQALDRLPRLIRGPVKKIVGA
jgi:hypothetical protein